MTNILSLARATFAKPILFTVTLFMSTHVLGSEWWDCCCGLDAYAGIDAQMRHMPFQKNFGGNILKRRYPEGNVFAGMKFNDYVGIEAGYEFSKKQHSTKTHQVGEVVFGLPIPPPEPELSSITYVSRASSKVNGFNLNLIGFLPILCEEYHTQLIGSVGIATLKTRIRNALTTTSVELIETILNPSGVPFTTVKPDNSLYKKRKTLFRMTAGIQYMTNCFIGIRGLVTWENTAQLKTRGKEIETGQISVGDFAKPKKSLVYGLGVFRHF